MSTLCGERPAANQSSAEDRKMKMMQQRRLHLDKQRSGAAAHFMPRMAQANTHAPMQRTKMFECSVVFRAEPLAGAEGTTEKKKEDPQDAQSQQPAAGLDLNNISPGYAPSDNISEATCNLAVGDQEAQRSLTPTSVLEPKSFLHGEEIRPSVSPVVQPEGDEIVGVEKVATKEKNGGRWWKPTFGLGRRTNSRPTLEAASPSPVPASANVGPRSDDIIQMLDTERPNSSSSNSRRRFHTATRDSPVPATAVVQQQHRDLSRREVAAEVIDTISCRSTPTAGAAEPLRPAGYPMLPAATEPSRHDASPSTAASCGLEAFENDSVEALPGCPA